MIRRYLGMWLWCLVALVGVLAPSCATSSLSSSAMPTSVTQLMSNLEGGVKTPAPPTSTTDKLLQSIELQLSVLKEQTQPKKAGDTSSATPDAPDNKGAVPEFLNVVADAPNMILKKWHQARVDVDLFIEKVQAQMLSPVVQERVFWGVLKVVLLVVAACVVYWPLRWILQKPLKKVLMYERGSRVGWGSQGMYFVVHALLLTLPFCAVLLCLYALLLFIEPVDEVRIFLLWLAWTLTVLMALRALIRLMWSWLEGVNFQNFPGLGRLGWWIQALVSVMWLSVAILKALALMGMTGMAMGLSVHLALLMNKILVGIALTVNHRVITRLLQSTFRMEGMEAPTSAENIFEDSWYGLTIVGLVLLYLAWLAGTVEDLGLFLVRTALSLGVLLIAGYFGARTLQHGQLIQTLIQTKWPTIAQRTQVSLQNPPSWVAWGIYGLGVLGILEIWRIGFLSWATSESFSIIVMKTLIIALIIFSVILIIKIMDSFVGRKLAQHPETEADGRLFAALTIGRSAFRVILIVTALLMILSELGVNTGPLLASLGLLGLAITWGSQSAMKDFVSGIIFILDGTTVVGDYIQINGGRLSRVEALLLHAIRLRDYDGSLHTVRYSQINLVVNATYRYSYATFEIGVGYDTDLLHAFELMKGVTQEMQQDPEFSGVILEEMDISGLDAYGASSLIIKARIKTLPKHQFKVRREYLRRLKNVFDAQNIDMPYNQFDVNVKGLGLGAFTPSPPPASPVGSSGAASIETSALGPAADARGPTAPRPATAEKPTKAASKAPRTSQEVTPPASERPAAPETQASTPKPLSGSEASAPPSPQNGVSAASALVPQSGTGTPPKGVSPKSEGGL